MTDDIVVIHGNGRALSGREEVIADLARSFERFRVRQRVEFDETIIAGDWAFDRARVHSSITPRDGGATREFDSRTITLLKRAAFGEWAVARTIGVVEQQQ
jgi:ketosteroid isomerase-like protein